ncbi:MAG: type II secretion system protein [Campylobacter sp.]|uniref:type II secretion system protein n=1 Tax=Campylobacter sp. TaxID=205 RepID=UPI002A7EBD89|nr:type II secretion system protein [Campylobacter sp.]MDY5115940.1 type II secretion system protein [Campylobacter sp.]
MKKGFTMIELIFVIVILGILASVAIPRLAATREDAEISATVANLRTLVSDATVYYTAKGSFNTNGSTKAKWSDITNVPLEGATNTVTNTGAKLKAGGKDCIAVQLVEKKDAAPAHIVITKEGDVTAVCTQVLASEPLKAYFSSKVTGVTNTDANKGYIAIGSSTSVYTTSTQ